MDKQPQFDLIDEPWIPVIRLADGQLVEVGLRDILTDPGSYREISDPSPLITISLHRLLLAILHRSLDGPKSNIEWDLIWRNGWDVRVVSAYLDRWKHRFDLFDWDRPFYQTSEIEYEYEKPISEVIHGFTLGNYGTLFDHRVAADPPKMTPAESARYLLSYLAFAPSGTTGFRSRHGEPQSSRYADAGLLAASAVVLVTGDTLNETLILNLHHYSTIDEEPFAFSGNDDQPTWERDSPARVINRSPDGYVDYLTWQGRRLRLRPEVDESGQVFVRRVVRMRGEQLHKGTSFAWYETMVAYRDKRRAKENEPAWNPISLQKERALWRDSTVLLQSVEGNNQPKTTEWLTSLVNNRYLDRNRRYTLDLFGMSSIEARIFLWRHERLPLSLMYLEDTELFRTLQEALELAESAGRLLGSSWVPAPAGVKATSVPSPMRVLAANLVSPADESNADSDAIRRSVSSLAPEPVYWSRLEVPFTRFMLRLADVWDPDDFESDAVLSLMDGWAREVRRIVLEAFQEVTDSLDLNDRELRAMAKGERQLYWQLRQLIDRFVTE